MWTAHGGDRGVHMSILPDETESPAAPAQRAADAFAAVRLGSGGGGGKPALLASPPPPSQQQQQQREKMMEQDQDEDDDEDAVAAAAETIKVPVTIEVCLHPSSTADPDAVRRALAEALEGRPLTLEDGPIDRRVWRRHPLLRAHCARVAVADADLIQPPAALPLLGREEEEEEDEEEQHEEGSHGAAAAKGGGGERRGQQQRQAATASTTSLAAATAALAAAAAASASAPQQEHLALLPPGGGARGDRRGHQPLPATAHPLRLAPGLTRDHFRQGARLMSWQYRPRVSVFSCSDEAYAEDDDDGGDAGGVPSYKELPLPSAHTQGLWESLHFGDGGALKRRLLRYASSALLFGEAGVDGTLVSWNRVVLLHGPPGTGKTTLCKALAHKLSARFAATGRYPAGGCLVEVCAHSLFSKWFSESGKLVSRLFAKITELVEEGDALVFVLVDEVESLAAARRQGGGGGGAEPSDAVRAVNALLTQLDALRRHPNVLVLTTSNLTEAVDVAFVDRADIKAYVGPPALPARYNILRSAVLELLRAGILVGDDVGTGGGGGRGRHGLVGGGLLEEEEEEEEEGGGEDDDEEDDDDDEEGGGGGAGGSSSPPPLLMYEQLERAARAAGGMHALAAAVLGAAAAAAAAAAGGSAGGAAASAAAAAQMDADGGSVGAAVAAAAAAASPLLAPQAASAAAPPTRYDPRLAASAALALAAEAAEGFSGRALRKLPFLAHAGAGRELPSPCGLVAFLDALRRAALRERRERRQLTGHGN